MTTLAKRRGKINGFIKEYEKRLAAYAEKYGPHSATFKIRSAGCKLKIKAWKNELERLAKRYDPVKDMMRAIRFTHDWYGVSPVGAIHRGGYAYKTENGYGVANNRSKFFLAKFAIENGLIQNKKIRLLGVDYSTCLQRRKTAITAMRKDKALSANYKSFEKALQGFLAEKQSPKFLDKNGKSTQPTEAVSN